MAARGGQNELSELASFVVGLARAVARDADRLHKAAALIHRTGRGSTAPTTDAALTQFRHCCRSLTDGVFRQRFTAPRIEVERDGNDAAPGGDAN